MKKNVIIMLMFFLLILVCYGCSKKNENKLNDFIDFKTKDVVSVKMFAVSEKNLTEENLKVTEQEEIQKLVDLIKQVEYKGKADTVPSVAAAYYGYEFDFGEGNFYRVKDYKESIQIIDIEGTETWYELTTNTWEEYEELWTEFSEGNINHDEVKAAKPVIYLYPEEPTQVSVKLDYIGELTYTYPIYQDGWRVLAYPDGTLENLADQKKYSYLFWEGKSDVVYDMSKGFIVKGSETTTFLEEKLSYLGLTREEYNEFIVYWAPKMFENNFNLITFQEQEYTESAKLTISPEPDSILRVFMVYQPLEETIELPQQKLTSWNRTGFSVVEWGGAELLSN